MDNYEIVKRDFNEIALLNEPRWNHNNCYFKHILNMLPAKMEVCLDIGCGKGELSHMLSLRSRKVVAVDLAEAMIERAEQIHGSANIDYICGNILDMDFEDNSVDTIVTTATAHHLPFDWLLNFAKEKLREDGELIILDIPKAEKTSDYVIWGLAFFPNIIMNLIHNGRLEKEDEHSKEVWKRHGENDVYMTMDEIKSRADSILPGAEISRKLFWRYTLMWKKPRG